MNDYKSYLQRLRSREKSINPFLEFMGMSLEELKVKLVTASPMAKSPHPRHDNDGQSYKKGISLIYPC